MTSKEKAPKCEKDYFDFLQDRLLELIALPVPADKYNSVENLIYRYTKELKDSIKEDKISEEISLEFKHYVKNILSLIEVLIQGECYRSLRRLLQNEIYSCCKLIISEKEKK